MNSHPSNAGHSQQRTHCNEQHAAGTAAAPQPPAGQAQRQGARQDEGNDGPGCGAYQLQRLPDGRHLWAEGGT